MAGRKEDVGGGAWYVTHAPQSTKETNEHLGACWDSQFLKFRSHSMASQYGRGVIYALHLSLQKRLLH